MTLTLPQKSQKRVGNLHHCELVLKNELVKFSVLMYSFRHRGYDCETCSFLGLVLPTPENLRVDVWDGEAAAHWSHPTNAPAGFRYNVEMAKYVSSGSPFVSQFSFICFLLDT